MRAELGRVWWIATIAAALGAIWLLLQALAVVIADNAPQTAILLGASLVAVGIPTFVIALCALVYAIRRGPSANVKRWRVCVALSAASALVPLLACAVLLAVKFGVV